MIRRPPRPPPFPHPTLLRSSASSWLHTWPNFSNPASSSADSHGTSGASSSWSLAQLELAPLVPWLSALLDAGFERPEEHTSELQSPRNLVCRLLLEKTKKCT